MTAPNDFHDLAVSKLARIFGDEKAQQLVREIINESGMAAIATAQDLLIFSTALRSRGGFESTVGAMLGLQAVLRGANAV